MEQIVSFPGLGIGEFTLNRVAFSLFGKPIYWYGVIIAVGFLLAITYAIKRSREFGLDADRVLDVIMGGAIGGVIGARIYYVVFSWADYKDNLVDVFKIWEGGIAIYGGIIGGFLVGALMCKWRKVRLLPMADLVTASFLLGQGIGRWGNFVNVEAFGEVTAGPLRMCSPSAANYLLNQGLIDNATAQQILEGTLGVQPTFFYESVWCLLGFLVLAWFTKKRRYDGQMTLLYAAWYGAERAIVEGMRTDSLMWGSVRVSQALAAFLTVVSVAALLYFHFKIKKANDSEYMRLYVYSEEAQAILRGEFYPKKKTENAEESVPAPQPEEAVQESSQETPTQQEETASAVQEEGSGQG